MSLEITAKYNNAYKKEYILEYKTENLIINDSSCYKATKEVAFLISFLPQEGEKIIYLEQLQSLGIADCEGVFNKLVDLGILSKKENVDIYHRVKMLFQKILSPKFIVISSQLQDRVLTKFFNSNLFVKQMINPGQMLRITGSIIATLFLLGIFLNTFVKVDKTQMIFTQLDNILLFVFVFLGIIVHELGHSLMCSYCGIGLRPIGVSAFLFYPVMFTNVSGMEELNLKDRVLVNISGLAAQGFYMFLLMFLYLAAGYINFFIAVQLLLYTFYFNLHPFIRTDGYWLFKDVMHFFQDNKIAKMVNNIYYGLYFVFSMFIAYKGYMLVKYLAAYFSHIDKIKFNVMLFINLFYAYLVVILLLAVMRRFQEFYKHFLRYVFCVIIV